MPSLCVKVQLLCNGSGRFDMENAIYQRAKRKESARLGNKLWYWWKRVARTISKPIAWGDRPNAGTDGSAWTEHRTKNVSVKPRTSKCQLQT